MLAHETIPHLFAGAKITRKHYQEGQYLYLKDGFLMSSGGEKYPWNEYFYKELDDYILYTEPVYVHTLKAGDKFSYDKKTYTVSRRMTYAINSKGYEESFVYETLVHKI